MEEQIKEVQKEIEDLVKQRNKIDERIHELNRKVLELYANEQKRLSIGIGISLCQNTPN
jgi:cell division protein FtsB